MTDDDKARRAKIKKIIKSLKDRHLSNDQLLEEAAEWHVMATDLFLIATDRPPFNGEEPEAVVDAQGAIRGYIAERARAGNIERRKRDEVHQAMACVFDCWQQWRKVPELYKGRTAFARAMRKKYPVLKSEDSIKNATRKWEKKPHEVRDGIVERKERSN